MFDELSVQFDNPADDPLGYNFVEGKLTCGRDLVELHFRQRDRAFRKGETRTVTFEYGEIEKVEYLSGWFRPKTLVLQTRFPRKLDGFPGASVGRVVLHVLAASRGDARKLAGLVELRQSEAFVAESEERLRRLRESES